MTARSGAARIRRSVVLGAGAVGTMLAGHLRRSGSAVCLVDVRSDGPVPAGCRRLRADVTDIPAALARELAKADLVVLALPEQVALAAAVAVADLLPPGALLVDTLSVKSRIAAVVPAVPAAVEMVGLNPMFAPALGIAGRPVLAVVLRDGPRVRCLLDLVTAWGGRVVRRSAAEHDRLTGAAQALTHAALLGFGFALAELDADLAALAEVAPPPHAALLALLARVVSGEPAVYWDIQAANPHAETARMALERGLRRVAETIARGDGESFAVGFGELRGRYGDRLAYHRSASDHLLTALPDHQAVAPRSGTGMRRASPVTAPEGESMPPSPRTALSHLTVLSPEQRTRLAADANVGGGNLLRSAIAANPHPELPFIHCDRPLTDTGGAQRHEFSLLQLDALAQSWSVWYLGQGVRPRDRVAVYLDDSFAYSLHFYALSQIGAIPVLINSRAPRRIAAGLCRQTDAIGLYTDRGRLADLAGEDLPGLRWTQLAEELPAPPAAALPERDRFRHADEDPVVILHSSGTTGRPKAVIHTHRSITAGPKFRLVDHKEAPGALMLTGLPQSHLGCIAYTAYAVLGGTPIVPLFDASGSELHEAVRRYRPTAVMAFGHTYSELAAVDIPPGSVDSVNVWISIGDAVHEPHIKKVLAQRSPHLGRAYFYDRLGTTELGWGVLLKIRTVDSERIDRCVGEPVGVADVAILRPDGTPADADEFGLLGARGPAITVGYWNDSDTTYRSKLAGYWLTGDIAYRNADGLHFQVDRAVDVIQTAGGPGYSVYMEEVILADVPDVSDCTVTAGIRAGHEAPVAVVKTSAADVDAEKLLIRANEALRASGHPPLALLEVVTDESDFPVGVTGKVLKRELRNKYHDLDGYQPRGHVADARSVEA